MNERFSSVGEVHDSPDRFIERSAAERARRPLDALRGWGLRLLSRGTHNKAAVAVANKLARIIWATWSRQRDFEFRADLFAVA